MSLTERHFALMGRAKRKYPACKMLIGRTVGDHFTTDAYGRLCFWFDIPINGHDDNCTTSVIIENFNEQIEEKK